MAIEAAPARVGPEIMAVGAVLHHQEHDVFHRAEVGTGRGGGGFAPELEFRTP
jgi:hypothetical protein